MEDAFHYAKLALSGVSPKQTPILDDNGNGIGNEEADGQAARSFIVGAGIMLAGDPPRIGSICPKKTLSGGTTATIWVNSVASTKKIASVWAVITPPGYLPGTPSGAITDLPTVILKKSTSGKYQASYPGFTTKGMYRISVYAMDRNGDLSLPKTTTVVRIFGR